jgi:hypothetical protein
MKILQLCVAAAIAAGVTTGPHVARAQALGEAATLSAGVSSAGSASGSALGNSVGRALRGEGGRLASSSKSSTSGGVRNLHWSREELERSATATRTQAKGNAKVGSARTTQTKAKDNAKVGSEKAQPDFVIVGADPQ